MVWKKGQSGNPSGTRKLKPITDALDWALKLSPKELENRTGKTAAQAIALAAVKEAQKASIPAFNAVADRVEGKPVQAHELTQDAETLALTAYNTEALLQVARLLDSAKLEPPTIDVTPDEDG